jgi:DNA-directed RNA polymerase subunit RPC12/RpoP
MPTDAVTCPDCGYTFDVGVPRGKRIRSYWAFSSGQGADILFACPNCHRRIGADLEDFKCDRY